MWADLKRRVFALDVLACASCSGRLRFRAIIEEPPVVIRRRKTDRVPGLGRGRARRMAFPDARQVEGEGIDGALPRTLLNPRPTMSASATSRIHSGASTYVPISDLRSELPFATDVSEWGILLCPLREERDAKTSTQRAARC